MCVRARARACVRVLCVVQPFQFNLHERGSTMTWWQMLQMNSASTSEVNSSGSMVAGVTAYAVGGSYH